VGEEDGMRNAEKKKLRRWEGETVGAVVGRDSYASFAIANRKYPIPNTQYIVSNTQPGQAGIDY
jgi:hypothetical protein